jgi:hypothetical protein
MSKGAVDLPQLTADKEGAKQFSRLSGKTGIRITTILALWNLFHEEGEDLDFEGVCSLAENQVAFSALSCHVASYNATQLDVQCLCRALT